MEALGKKTWVIAEGYIPGDDPNKDRSFISHETACILNSGDEGAVVELTIFYSNREPAGPYIIHVPARRTKHMRFNELQSPEPIPRDTDYSSVFKSNVPVVIQHTRLDSRWAEATLLTTIAYSS